MSGAVIKCFKKVVGSEQLFFYVARHYYLTGRPNRLFFRFRGRGSGGVPGGAPGAARRLSGGTRRAAPASFASPCPEKPPPFRPARAAPPRAPPPPPPGGFCVSAPPTLWARWRGRPRGPPRGGPPGPASGPRPPIGGAPPRGGEGRILYILH
jgi:hypothetical protein